jgi:hypothetical protein
MQVVALQTMKKETMKFNRDSVKPYTRKVAKGMPLITQETIAGSE